MKAVEFCYWLQGYFELRDAAGVTPGAFGADVTKCIKAHLALVKKVDPNHRNAFVMWLDLFLRDPPTMSAQAVEAVRATLAVQFQHVIDPSYGGDEKALMEAHGIGGVGPDGQVYRC